MKLYSAFFRAPPNASWSMPVASLKLMSLLAKVTRGAASQGHAVLLRVFADG
jgi:hypothetical protein